MTKRRRDVETGRLGDWAKGRWNHEEKERPGEQKQQERFKKLRSFWIERNNKEQVDEWVVLFAETGGLPRQKEVCMRSKDLLL